LYFWVSGRTRILLARVAPLALALNTVRMFLLYYKTAGRRNCILSFSKKPAKDFGQISPAMLK